MHTKIIINVDYNVDIKTLKCIKHNFKKKETLSFSSNSTEINARNDMKNTRIHFYYTHWSLCHSPRL